ncbi:MAG: hypothetical protein AMJ69_12185 [Gammaproteobacteria bacterium SG8_47]|nr:MAG: hypothetical protein AMJ69_12185 [Gammaproteobacteria bacterium SG8_47]
MNAEKHSSRLGRFALVCVWALALSACAVQPSGRGMDMMEEELAASMAQSTPSATDAPSAADIGASLIPPLALNLPSGEGVPAEPRFDIKVNRAPAREFFMGLVEGTPYNMIVHPEVSGYLTLDLKNVTIAQAMHVVRNVYGYDFERSDNSFQVLPNALRTRIFSVNYVNVQRAGESELRVSSGQVSQRSAKERDGEGGDTSAKPNVVGSKISTKTTTDLWAELALTLQALVGNEPGRSVVVSSQTGVVVVRAMPHELRAVEEYLVATQAVLNRQVVLEAKILEVELSDGFQSGINWAALAQSNGDSILAGQTGGGSSLKNLTSEIAGNDGNLNPGAYDPINNTAVSAFGGVFSLALNVGDFTAFIELLQTQGEVHVLSSPRVSTVNNQKAVIKVGSDEFFVTDIESNTNLTTGVANTNNNVELTPFFSGVALDVIPQISGEGDIVLHVHPSVSRVEEQVKNIGVEVASDDPAVQGTARGLFLPLAFSTIRESDSVIRARSGQVVVIGGLMQTITNDEVSSVPVLGELPWVGSLFRHTRQVTRKSELVILLRPVIVADNQAWSDSISASRRSLEQLKANPWTDAPVWRSRSE